MAKRHRRNEAADFGDEDAVLAEVAKELKEDAEDLKIDEDRGLTGFGEGVVYRISGRGRGGKHGGREWCVVESDEVANELAKQIVTQDLEEEPGNFHRAFIERHIDMDRLRQELEESERNLRIDSLSDTAERDPDRFWDEWEQEGFVLPDDAYGESEDDRGDARNPDQTEIEKLAESQIEESLRDPMEYLEDSYSREEAIGIAIKIAGFDIDAAAEDAVDTDGWQHFLSRYDGNSDETKSGFVFWREN